MNKNNDLTTGSVGKKLVAFALPYLLAAFLQTFYGMADLYVVGQFDPSKTTTAVSIGSQVMHMLTVVILGFVMGTTVQIGHSIGSNDKKEASKVIGTSTLFFIGVSILLTILLQFLVSPIVSIMNTPTEAVSETILYLRICFAGIPFITAYNVISGIFRGIGDSKSPLFFVFVACVVNVVLDFVFIGAMDLGAAGAALGTVLGQTVSVIISFIAIRRMDLGFKITKSDFFLNSSILKKILSVGTPVALQDGFIQVAFLIITVIANSRGLTDAAAVGIVEKIISFLFLVPSAFLSAISAITAQNMGAGKPERARKTLRYGLIITMSWGLFVAIYNQFLPNTLVGLFTKDAAVLVAGCAYLRSYSIDTFFAAIHFCFSGYFTGDQKSGISFLHNFLSVTLIRVPGTYLASKMFPDTLFPMGLAAPAGSLLSSIICIGFYVYYRKTERC